MEYLWNTGALSHKLAAYVRDKTGIPLYVADHPVPQSAECAYMSERYVEENARRGGFIALCSERKLTATERNLVNDYWIGKRK